MRINSRETEIGDDRIEELTRDYLVLIGRDESGWETLYQDPSSGEYWVMSYPYSHHHGGGMPTLKRTSIEDAQQRFQLGDR
ncbi:MAG: Imm27 family immunity protein [Devosia sp.]